MLNLNYIKISIYLFLISFISAYYFSGNAVSATEHHGVVLQVSEADPIVWNLALNIAENAPKNVDYPLKVSVIAFGPGLKMLKMDSTVANRLERATANGVEFRACGMTMKKLKMKDEDLYPSHRIKRVDGGVIEIMRLQRAGWAYIKP